MPKATTIHWLLATCVVALSWVGLAAAEDSVYEEPTISDGEREHWSFRPLTRPALPDVSPTAWVVNPVDRFILSKLERKQLTPQPPSDRVTLLRRLSFDLRGLPPTIAELDAFVADPAPDAYERLVDRLLASPQYGEHRAQAWLDLARFAETDGFEHDKVREQAWRYRDWVISALNADLPYDRFVGWQIAGDELQPGHDEARIATAFCLSGPDMPDINSQEERQHNLLNEMTATVGSVLLGLQFGCAACHDHKYDPISQADFYRLRAIFEPAVTLKKNQSVSTFDERPATTLVSHLMLRGDWRRPGPELAPAFPRIANPSSQPFAVAPADGSTGRRAALAHWLTSTDNPLTSRVIANRVWQWHFGDGLSRTPSDVGVTGDEPSHPELLDWLATELVRSNWSLKHLQRLILTSATYRQASLPRSSEWTPEQQAAAEANWRRSLEVDRADLWLSRFPRRRLSGEMLRDAMLAASETLTVETGGPGVRPPLPRELVQTLLKDQWEVNARTADHYRRSIYVFARRNLRYPIFEAFDRPDGNASCPRRNRSTTAPQSLLMLNSNFSLEAARRLAGCVLREHAVLDDRTLTDLHRRLLSRRPSADELQEMQEFLNVQLQLLRTGTSPPDEAAAPLPPISGIDPIAAVALTDLCLALLNSNEFLYVD